jgi:hypothetical protein
VAKEADEIERAFGQVDLAAEEGDAGDVFPGVMDQLEGMECGRFDW